MTAFIAPDVITDPLVIAANAKAFLESELPGWHSSPGSIEDLIIDAFSYTAAEQAEALEAELVAAYKSLGALVGVVPIEAQPAKGIATFTVIDAAGYTLTATGTVIGVRDANNDLQTFRLTADLIIPATKTTGTATVEATEPGADGNSLSGTAELVAADGFVVSATLATTGEGLDEEEENVFLDRLTEELAIQKPGPVLAVDSAILARNVAGVFRATAVDNLQPSAADGGEGSETSPVEKCVTVACVNEDGTACSAEVRAAVASTLTALREANFKFFVVKPHYTKIDVTCTVFAWPGLNTAAVKAEVLAALEAYLSPGRWAAEQTGRPETWRNDPIVRQAGLLAAVQNVLGVRWCSSLTFGKHGEALGTANVTLGSGSAVPALPDVKGNADGTSTPATFTITVEPST